MTVHNEKNKTTRSSQKWPVGQVRTVRSLLTPEKILNYFIQIKMGGTKYGECQMIQNDTRYTSFSYLHPRNINLQPKSYDVFHIVHTKIEVLDI